MNKILIIGDPHFRFELSHASAFPDGRREEWETIKKIIYKESEKCNAVVLMGDNFNARHNHSSVVREFIDFLKQFGDKEVHILAGNHERYGTSTALDFIKKLDHENWFIYTEPTLTSVAGAPTMMIPFMTPALLWAETKEKGVKALLKLIPKEKTPLAFIHQGIMGSSINNVPVDFFEEMVLPRKEIEKNFEQVFAGHIHGKQFLPPNILITGSIFTTAVGEYEKSIWIYNTEKKTVKEITLPGRGIYKVIWEEKDKRDEIPKNSIVKCYVTSRETDLGEVKKFLDSFDASILIEQYPNIRDKVHFEGGALDFSVDSLLKMYSEAKKISYDDIKQGFDLIK